MMQDLPASPPDDALPLREAMRRFVSEDLWRAYEEAAEARKKLPRRPSYFSTSIREWEEAAQANVTANQARSAQSDMHRAWVNIKRALIEQLIAGDLAAFAQADPPFQPWRPIPAAAWRNLQIKDVRHGRVMGPNVDLVGLHITAARKDGGPGSTTGGQGRPSKSMHLVKAEFARRIGAGQIEESLIRQSRVLETWFRTNHPDKAPPTAKTIENSLRNDYREAARNHANNPPK